MGFKMKYKIREELLTKPSKRRSGDKLEKVLFIVAHDTGNKNSTALNNVNYYQNSRNEISASAHLFVDDKEIIKCIPLNEKAWHVLYSKPNDNKLFGEDANDGAIGVELCYFENDKKRNEESYKKYIWTLAYLCYTYKLDPKKHITTHMILDPERKSDPYNAMSQIGKVPVSKDKELNAKNTLAKLITDVIAEYAECIAPPKPAIIMPTLREGSIGNNVIKLQKLLKITADGIFGPATEKAVIAFQKKNKLVADGIVGKATWDKLI